MWLCFFFSLFHCVALFVTQNGSGFWKKIFSVCDWTKLLLQKQCEWKSWQFNYEQNVGSRKYLIECANGLYYTCGRNSIRNRARARTYKRGELAQVVFLFCTMRVEWRTKHHSRIEITTAKEKKEEKKLCRSKRNCGAQWAIFMKIVRWIELNNEIQMPHKHKRNKRTQQRENKKNVYVAFSFAFELMT